MGIFSGMARIFGRVDAKVNKDKGVVIVTGIPAKDVSFHMAVWLKTHRVEQHMFVVIKSSYFAFYEFYALEVKATLESIIAHPKSNYKLRRVLTKIIDAITEVTWLRHEHRNDVKPMIDLSKLSKLKWKPKPHQLEGLKAYGDIVPRYGFRGYYMAAQPGTGKTFYDIALATVLIPDDLAEYKIIISPKNAIEAVWEDTINECFVDPPSYWISTDKGKPPLDREYYIFHFESMDRAVELSKQLTLKHKKYFVIIDEAHNFNNLSSIRTNQLITICRHAAGPYSIWASGSPIKALGNEIVPLLKCIDPLFTDAVARGFSKIFGGVNKRANEIVYRRFGLISFKVPTSEVAEIQKPIPLRVNVKVPDATRFLLTTVKEDVREYVKERVEYYTATMDETRAKFKECIVYHEQTLKTEEDRDRYREYQKQLDFIIKNQSKVRGHMDVLGELNRYEKEYLMPSLTPELKRQFVEVRTIVKALALKVTGEAVGNVYTQRIAECSAALAKHVNIEEIIDRGVAKTLIFSNWSEPLEVTEKELIRKGYKTAHIYGKETKNTAKIVKAFHADPDINPLFATYSALSTAVPVTAANQIVMLDYPYREYIYSQTVARAARMGQQHQVYVYELALDTGDEPNVSTRSIDICEFTREQVSEILGEDFGGFTEEDYSSEIPNLNLPLVANPNVRAKPAVAMGVVRKALGIFWT